MPRGLNPLDPDAGPLAAFAWDLRALREKAGGASYRVLAKRAGYSASTLSVAASGTALPSLDVTLAYVQACGGDPEEWTARWTELSALLSPLPQSTAAKRSQAAPAIAAPGAAPGAIPAARARSARRYPARHVWLITGGTILAAAAAVTAGLLAVAPASTRTAVPGANTRARPSTSTLPGGMTSSGSFAYDQTIGPGCPSTPLAHVHSDPLDNVHYWWSATAARWTVPRCANLILYSANTTASNPDQWQNDYEWFFNGLPPGAPCVFHVYIPVSPHAEYNANYDWTVGDTAYVEGNALQIDQAAHQGRWVDEGPFSFPTGQAMLRLTDARHDKPVPDFPMAAAAVRLTCARS